MADIVFLEDYSIGLEDNNEGDGGEELSDMGACEDEGEDSMDGGGNDMSVNPDELLPPLARLQKYADSEITFNRQVVARSLLDTLRSVVSNPDDVETVISIVSQLSDDVEPGVRAELMEQVPALASFCREQNGNLAQIIPEILVPIIVKYLTDVNNQVRKAAQGALLVMLEQHLVDKGQLEKDICPLILQLTQAENMDDHRTEAVVLMSKMAPLVGREVTEQLFLHRFAALCQDVSFHVRKVCASNFGEFCAVVGQESTEKLLLPKFFSLCEDSVWGVRKSCAEVFMPVSCVCSMDVRRTDLANLFVNLLCDSSRWVKTSAFQALGPFISTFANPSKTGLCCSEDGIQVMEEEEEERKYLEIQRENEEARNYEISKNSASTTPVVENGYAAEEQRQQQEEEESQRDSGDENEKKGDDDQNVLEESFPKMSLEDNEELENSSEEVTREMTYTTSACESSEMDLTNDNEALSNGLCKLVCDSRFSPQSMLDVSPEEQRAQRYASLSTSNLPNQISTTPELSRVVEDFSNVFGGMEDSRTIKFPSIRGGDSSAAAAESFTVTANNGHIHLHLDNESTFNNFQYWRVPLPELELDVDIEEGKTTNIHVRARVPCAENRQVFASDMSVKFTSSKPSVTNGPTTDNSGESTSTDNFEKKGSATNEDGLNQAQVQTACFASVLDSSGNQNVVHNLDSSYNEACLTFVHGELTGIKKTRTVRYDFDNKLVFNINSQPQGSTNMYVGDVKYLVQSQDIVPPQLLEHYLSMTNSSHAHLIDAEIARYCAYSFPAVAFTLGRKFWPCLRETFEILASDLQWKVRRTLASSIHELAVILGSDLAAQDLLPIFYGFLRDLDEVRIGILQHLSVFLKLLKLTERRDFLPQLGDFLKLDNDRNWRFRLALGEQLIQLADIYSPSDVREFLVPLALSLVKDRVCEVRQQALRVMAVMLRRIGQSQYPSLLKGLLSELADQFTHAPKWSVRQTFPFLCEHLIYENAMPLDQFARDVLPHLLYLCWDCVANVRMAVARCLSRTLLSLDYFSSSQNPHHDLLLEALQSLQKDTDRDVRFYAHSQPSCILSEDNVENQQMAPLV